MRYLFLLFICFTLKAEIVEIYSFKQIEPINKETLVVLDMDQTLIFAKDPYFQSPSFIPKRELIHKFMEGWSDQKKKICKHLMGMMPEQQLVEEGWDEQITQWQNEGISIIALTAASGEIPNALEMRSKQLRSVGIDLSRSAPDLSHIPFPNKDGIIMTGEGSLKADVIAAFADFEKVIMVDDILNYLEYMKDSHPGFNGYHYRKIEMNKVHPLDDEILLEKWGDMEKKTDEVMQEIMVESGPCQSPD